MHFSDLFISLEVRSKRLRPFESHYFTCYTVSTNRGLPTFNHGSSGKNLHIKSQYHSTSRKFHYIYLCFLYLHNWHHDTDHVTQYKNNINKHTKADCILVLHTLFIIKNIFKIWKVSFSEKSISNVLQRLYQWDVWFSVTFFVCWVCISEL